jgi:hypothetical protein
LLPGHVAEGVAIEPVGVETADAVESAKFAAAEPIVGESGSPAEAARATEPVSSQVCVPKTATAKVAAAELPSAEMAAGEMSSAEMPATEMHASEMAASEATEVTEASEMTAAETSEMTAAAGSTVPKGKSFAHHARHASARRERGFETEPERDRRCENFSHPTSHGGLLPPRCGTMIPSLLRTHQRLGGSARSMEFKYGLSNERESSTNRAVALMAEDFPRRPM